MNGFGGGGLSRSLGDTLRMVAGLAPVAGTGSAQNGAWIDRNGFFAAIVPFAYSTSGGVTGGTITVKLQDATSNAGAGSADFGAVATITIPAGPNASGVLEVVRSLDGARQFIRVVIDSDPSGGTPASIVSAPLILGCPDRAPV
jgi:hypothetical protein